MIFSLYFFALWITVKGQISLEFTIPEERPPRTFVGNVNLSPVLHQPTLSPPSRSATFQLLTQTQLFELNETSGDLYTKISLDREVICKENPLKEIDIKRFGQSLSDYESTLASECRTQIQILRFHTPPSEYTVPTVIIVNVIILDINDNPPGWTENIIHLNVPEHTAIGTRFPIPTAFDPDCGLANTTARYTLLYIDPTYQPKSDQHTSDFDNVFQLDSELVPGSTNADLRQESWLRPTAAGCLRRKFQLWLRVTRDIDYENKEILANFNSHADVPFATNSIHLRKLGLKLIAVDNGQPTALTGSVIINVTISDINDHVPKFKVQHETSNNELTPWKSNSMEEDFVEVEENAPIGRTIYSVHVIDQDESDQNKLVYGFSSTVSSSIRAMFDVNKKTGDVFLLRSPDYEKQKSHILPLTVSDGKHIATMQLIVGILNRNDHAPSINIQPVGGQKFTNSMIERFGPNAYTTGRSITLYVKEHEPPGVFIATVTVTDLDDVDSDPQTAFHAIQLPTTGNLVHSDKTAHEGSNSLQCQISHNSLTLAPLFEGTTTQFKLLTAASFDREQQSEQFATLTCIDRGKPALSSQISLHFLVEDINDHPPVIKSGRLSANVKENEPAGTKIHTIEANDLDAGSNAKLGFSLSPESTEDLQIDQHTGVITTVRSFDREVQSYLNVTVIVFDQADTNFSKDQVVTPFDFTQNLQDKPAKNTDRFTVKSNLIIHIQDVNDCPPTFTNSLYQFSVSEDAKINHMIGQVLANDSDATEANNQVHYMIKHQSDSHIVQEFRVSPQGYLYVARGNLDREKVPSYNFYLVAIDSGSPALSSTTQVHIYLTDVNDNSPSWVFPAYNNQGVNVSVNEPVGYRVAQLNAVDPDEAENGDVTYRIVQINRVALREQIERRQRNDATHIQSTESHTSNYKISNEGATRLGRRTVSNLFELDSSSGSIYVGRSMSLDDIGTVKLVVEASDKGSPPKLSHRVLQINILRFMFHAGQAGSLDIDSMNAIERNQLQGALQQNGPHYENDLIVIVIMVAVTLIISLALIISILFLRCGLCPSSRWTQFIRGQSRQSHRERGHTHHLEEVFRDSVKVDDMFIPGPPEHFGNCNHTLSRYQNGTCDTEPMCRSYLSTPGIDPWNVSPKHELLTGYETFRCNRSCGPVMKLQQAEECIPLQVKSAFEMKHSLTDSMNKREELRVNSSTPNHGCNSSSTRAGLVPFSTYQTLCSHMKTSINQTENTKIEDIDSMDSGHGCSRTTENDASSPQEDGSPQKSSGLIIRTPIYRCHTPQNQTTKCSTSKIAEDSSASEHAFKPITRSRSGTLPNTSNKIFNNSVPSTQSSNTMCVHLLNKNCVPRKPGVRDKQTVSWLEPDYQTCVVGDAASSTDQKDQVETGDGTFIVLTGVDPLGYARLIHPARHNADCEHMANTSTDSSFPTSFV